MENAADQFRSAMSAFATGVAVVTARRGDEIWGITVNSLASVSLRPALLLWCLGDQSERYDIFADAASWGVTLLGGDDEATARRFTLAKYEAATADECETLSGVPILRNGIAHIACRTHERRAAGDHLIIIGEALALREASGAALSFYRGRYGRIEDPRG
jgi:flavin reductase (DIM6/NTAB) family NADH-FMN oxidoreductase RutF